jgi:pimeloyl-ACP methyl ester carboxylesterase
LTLHLRTFGGGEPLVCLHGIGEGGAHFEPLAARLPGYRLLAPDLRGHGRSEWEPPWSLEQHLEDVLATVGEEPRTWLGHSFGGRLCVELANRRPELVERLILLDPALRLQPANAFRLAEAERQGSDPVDRSRASVIAMFGELTRPSPPFPRVPTLLVLGRDESVVGQNRRQLYAEALGPLLETVVVPGGHTVLRDAFEETAAAVSRLLARPAAARRP